jgi:serine protease Do
MKHLSIFRTTHVFFYVLFSLALFAQNAQARELPEFSRLVEQYGPAVVNISTKQMVHNNVTGLPPGMDMPDFPKGTPWDDLLRRFFGDGGHGGQMPQEHEARSLGSGFIIDSKGYILTNNHVVEGADEIIVRLSDRRELVAKLVGADKRSDIALLKVDATNLPLVKLGNSNDLKVAEWVMAIGSPFGFDHSVSVGVVSALGRSLPSENYVPFIQTDVAINPGNSGGPLFNLDGEVVGINSQIYSRTGGFMGLSFAIPIDVAMDVVHQIEDQGHVTRGWLGVLIQDVTRELAESFNMKRPHGALVAQVMDGSPAEKGGIEVGDIITEYNGEKISYSSDLPHLVGRTRVGTDAKIKVLRDGKVRSLVIRIGELPEEEKAQDEKPKQQKLKSDRLGLQVSDLSAAQRKELELSSGVLVEQVDSGAASAAGIVSGDVIVKIGGKKVDSVAQYHKLIKALDSGDSVPVLVVRHGNPHFLALRVPKD